jgi:hypothetical protein
VAIKPTPGLVIRYDFLWKDDHDTGLVQGRKDRPCTVVLVSEPRDENAREVVVCAISHTPPDPDTPSVEIPYKVTQHLGLDDDRMWIKTDQVNVFRWEEGRLPFGVTPARKGEWSFGVMPYQLAKAAFDQVSERSREQTIVIVKRE